MKNLWHLLATGPAAPERVYMVVEIPKGSRNKYEYDKEIGSIRLDRVLYSSMHYPGEYGLIPGTYYDDGDPLDILVIINEPTFPGCIIEARPIGIFRMMDGTKQDDKILAVPATDPLFREYLGIKDVPPHYLKEVAHFFQVYKDLEGKRVRPMGWEDADSACHEIERAMHLYQEKFPSTPAISLTET